MDDWIDFYDSAHSIYVSKLHREVHYAELAADIVGYIPSSDATVLDYSCGEALSADRVASACGRLILAEPAPNVRGRLAARFAPIARIEVRSLDELRLLPDGSVDLAVMNSVAQYMTAPELGGAFALVRRLLKPGGTLLLGDVLQTGIGMATDVAALTRYAASRGFLKDALIGMVRTALSDYRRLRARVGLQHYSEAEIVGKLAAAGFSASRAAVNTSHNQSRMTFVARPA